MKSNYDALMEMVMEEDGKTSREKFLESFNGIDDLKVYADEENSYMIESDIFDFMKANHIYSVVEAQNVIAQIKNIDEETMLVLEVAPENDSMSVRQAMKWYGKFVAASKSKTDNLEEIDAKIKVLERCVKHMKAAKEDPKKDGLIKFTLKSLIPFNDIARLVGKYHDPYAILASVVGGAGNLLVPGLGSVITVGMRIALYNKMLDRQIARTE